jgi:hypothetical protein
MMSNSVVNNWNMLVKLGRTTLFLLSMPVILSGCLALLSPAEIKYDSGAVVQSLSSSDSLV